MGFLDYMRQAHQYQHHEFLRGMQLIWHFYQLKREILLCSSCEVPPLFFQKCPSAWWSLSVSCLLCRWRWGFVLKLADFRSNYDMFLEKALWKKGSFSNGLGKPSCFVSVLEFTSRGQQTLYFQIQIHTWFVSSLQYTHEWLLGGNRSMIWEL